MDELGELVGMSRRNIRAYQARKLLPPPVRIGRVAYYDESHLRRLEAVKAFQCQGFNLVAIQALLGAPSSGSSADSLADLVRRVCASRPQLAYALVQRGLVTWGADGDLRVVRPRVLRSAVDLRTTGLTVGEKFDLLIEVLDRVRLVADDLVQTTSVRAAGVRAPSWEEYDEQVDEVSRGIGAMLVEAFRLAVEHSSVTAVPEMAGMAGADLRGWDAAGVDNG